MRLRFAIADQIYRNIHIFNRCEINKSAQHVNKLTYFSVIFHAKEQGQTKIDFYLVFTSRMFLF